MRAHEVYESRCETPIDRYPVRYALVDKLTNVRMMQAQSELALTDLVLRIDDLDSDLGFEELVRFRESETPHAVRSFQWIIRSPYERFVPEIVMYLARLRALKNDAAGPQAIEQLRGFLDSGGRDYQRKLLDIQAVVFAASHTAAIISAPDEDFDEMMSDVPDETAQQLKAMYRDADLSHVGDDLFANLYKFQEKYDNKYWYAKGLCATYLLAAAAGRDEVWLGHLKRHVGDASMAAGRPDWPERIESYGETNFGFWLTAY